MIKSHNHTFGLLNAQYRSVLKKCLQLNLLASGFVLAVSQGVSAAETVIPTDNTATFPYSVSGGNSLILQGNYGEGTSDDGSFIVQNDTGIVKIVKVTSGEAATGTVVNGKQVNAIKVTTDTDGNKTYGTPKNVFGGLIQVNGNITEDAAGPTPNDTISLVQINVNGDTTTSQVAKFTNNKIVAENLTSGSLSLGGGVLASLQQDDGTNITKRDNNFDIQGVNVVLSNNGISIEDNRTLAPMVVEKVQANGGALYVLGSAQLAGSVVDGNYTSSLNNNTIVINSVASLKQEANGGALYNKGYTSLQKINIDSNSVSADVARGGAIYNAAADVNGDKNLLSKLIVENSALSNNKVDAGRTGLGGALFNSSKTETIIVDSSLTGNSVAVDKDDKISEMNIFSYGGAVFNNENGNLSINAKNSDVAISNNSAQAKNSTESAAARGGAIYNDVNGTIKINADDHKITVSSNKAGLGGAMFNSGNLILSSTDSGSYEFSENNAKDGGAVYNNDSVFAINADAENQKVVFNKNVASGSGVGNGGAVNIYKGHMTVNLGNKSALSMTSNSAQLFGGAVYVNENSFLTLNNIGAGNIEFSKNSAVSQGGAIYNKGTVTMNVGSGSLTFDGNKAELGGAVYNTEGGVVTVNLGNSGALKFASATDTIFNDGTITITGSDTTSKIEVNTDITGKGGLNVDKATLTLNNSIVSASQNLKFTNSDISLQKGANLNLNSGDTLTDNNITTVADAIINYTASDSAPNMKLANTFTHGGVLNAQDGIISTISVDKFVGESGTIYLDVNKETKTADILKVGDAISGEVNMKLNNAEILNDEGVKIKFAEVADSSSDYNFIFENGDTVYNIEMVSEVSGGVRSWYLYHGGSVRSEVVNYLMLPRVAVEQTRGINVDISENDNTPRIRYEYGYGNKLRRIQDNNNRVTLWANPVYRHASFKSPIETKGNIWGVDAGLNMNVSSSSKTGLFVSYRDGSYNQNGVDGKYYSLGDTGDLDMTSTLVGLYYNKYFGRLYLKGMAYGGEQKARISNGDVSASAKALQAGVEVETGYNAAITSKTTLTPMVKASYDYISFDDFTDSTGKKTSIDTINDVELEAGLKLSQQFNNEHQLPTSGYVKTSVVQLVENGGSASVQNIKFDDMLKNETAGRVEIGGEAALWKNFVVGGFGNYTFGSDYNGFAVGGNVRYSW